MVSVMMKYINICEVHIARPWLSPYMHGITFLALLLPKAFCSIHYVGQVTRRQCCGTQMTVNIN